MAMTNELRDYLDKWGDAHIKASKYPKGFAPVTTKFVEDMKEKLREGGNWLTYWEVAALIDIAKRYMEITERTLAKIETLKSYQDGDEPTAHPGDCPVCSPQLCDCDI
jgi:hypothetical protein